jgi:transcription termination factor Rho
MKMLTTNKKTNRKLSKEELKARRDKKRVLEIKSELNKQYTVIGFYRLFSFEGEDFIKTKEQDIKNANENIVVLEEQIRRITGK